MSNSAKKTICVLGLGYIGLPTSSLLASKGFRVHGVDVNKSILAATRKGESHIMEKDLDVLVRASVGSGNLSVSDAPRESDVFIITVPTPFTEDLKPDLTFIDSAVESIAPVLRSGNLVILESTSPVGTTNGVADKLKELRPDVRDMRVCYCPERVLPGRILLELVENDRIIGGVDEDSTQAGVDFYSEFVTGTLLATDCRTAEMAKLTENAFRDTNIAFANEISLICNKLGINDLELIQLANRHPRVNILNPGPGVGGHCIAVDPWFIVDSAGSDARLIRAAREVNDQRPLWVVDRILARATPETAIGLLGLTYKPNVDDLRCSPAMLIADNIKKKHGGKVLLCEPNVKPNALTGIPLSPLEDVLAECDLIVALVDHKQFAKLDTGEAEFMDFRGIAR